MKRDSWQVALALTLQATALVLAALIVLRFLGIVR
jgi:hypothetical protein